MQWGAKRAVMPKDSKGFKIPVSRNERGSLTDGVVWCQLDKWILNMRAGQKKKWWSEVFLRDKPSPCQPLQRHSARCNRALWQSPQNLSLEVYRSLERNTAVFLVSPLRANSLFSKLTLFAKSKPAAYIHFFCLSRKYRAWQSHQ